MAFPMRWSATSGSPIPECDEKLAAHHAFPLVSRDSVEACDSRASRDKACAASRARWTIQNGGPVTRCSRSYGPSFDLRVPYWHLDEAAELARDFPDMPIALNHTGYPWDRSPAGLAGWRKSMEALARSPNVHVKVSELGLPDRPGRWRGNRGVVLDAISIFGIERCMFGSNFPGRRPVRPLRHHPPRHVRYPQHRPQSELEAFFHCQCKAVLSYRLRAIRQRSHRSLAETLGAACRAAEIPPRSRPTRQFHNLLFCKSSRSSGFFRQFPGIKNREIFAANRD